MQDRRAHYNIPFSCWGNKYRGINNILVRRTQSADSSLHQSPEILLQGSSGPPPTVTEPRYWPPQKDATHEAGLLPPFRWSFQHLSQESDKCVAFSSFPLRITSRSSSLLHPMSFGVKTTVHRSPNSLPSCCPLPRGSGMKATCSPASFTPTALLSPPGPHPRVQLPVAQPRLGHVLLAQTKLLRQAVLTVWPKLPFQSGSCCLLMTAQAHGPAVGGPAGVPISVALLVLLPILIPAPASSGC